MEARKKEIDGIVYHVQQLDALSALKIQAKLLKIFGPAIGELKGSKLTTENIRAKAGEAILSLAEKFDDEVVVDLILSLFVKDVNYEHTDGELLKVSFDMHFTGKISTMWKVALFILEVNFGDLLGKLKSGSLIKEELAKATKEL